MTRNWVAVASAEHVRRGHAEGFMQVCHGKAAPLRRVNPGDRVVYYSPTTTFRGSDKLQAFTALGVVAAGDPFAVDMGNGFCPSRRSVAWLGVHIAPIAPLIQRLSFTSGKRNWGYLLRTGLFAIDERDMRIIAHAMGVDGLPGRLVAHGNGQAAEPAHYAA